MDKLKYVGMVTALFAASLLYALPAQLLARALDYLGVRLVLAGRRIEEHKHRLYVSHARPYLERINALEDKIKAGRK